ncbi:MAG: haloacid dehalogenase-like hydrolase [Oscillospiraceae bacterium]|jgi:hypothetical protein|nr:haloacid dehalogenase-like hydrolase [Oscillospiraceae bacterium]
MPKKNPTVAVLYDFDKTLSPSNMQEYGFLPAVGMTPQTFWAESERLAQESQMDRILAYMYLMLQKAEGKTQITRQAFVDKGRTVTLFPGLEDWFDRVNAYARQAGVNAEHFIISSGLAEIIQGTPIVRQFKKVFASSFYYDLNGVARWPAWAVNFTSKTQFLFRINKGVLDLNRDDELNLYVPEGERPIPFSRMIYIGDGFSDVPCMKLVKSGGGCSIGVYAGRTKETVVQLVAQNRVDFVARADYSAGKELETILFRVLDLVAARYRMDALVADRETGS